MQSSYNQEELAVIVPRAKELNNIISQDSNTDNKRKVLNLLDSFPTQEQRLEFLNYSDQETDTPLITAAINGSHDWVKFLLDLGANKDAKNAQDETVFDCIREYGNGDQRISNFISSYQPTPTPSSVLEAGAASTLYQQLFLGL